MRSRGSSPTGSEKRLRSAPSPFQAQVRPLQRRSRSHDEGDPPALPGGNEGRRPPLTRAADSKATRGTRSKLPGHRETACPDIAATAVTTGLAGGAFRTALQADETGRDSDDRRGEVLDRSRTPESRRCRLREAGVVVPPNERAMLLSR